MLHTVCTHVKCTCTNVVTKIINQPCKLINIPCLHQREPYARAGVDYNRLPEAKVGHLVPPINELWAITQLPTLTWKVATIVSPMSSHIPSCLSPQLFSPTVSAAFLQLHQAFQNHLLVPWSSLALPVRARPVRRERVVKRITQYYIALPPLYKLHVVPPWKSLTVYHNIIGQVLTARIITNYKIQKGVFPTFLLK